MMKPPTESLEEQTFLYLEECLKSLASSPKSSYYPLIIIVEVIVAVPVNLSNFDTGEKWEVFWWNFSSPVMYELST